MKNLTLKSTTLFIFTIVFSLIAVNAQKLTADEVVAKHLESIGSKDKRSAIKNQFIFSDVQFKIKGTPGTVLGKGVILSEGNKNLFGFNLDSNDYPQERFGFDGRETQVGFSRPGVRSALGGFILTYKDLLKEGLLGGTLLSSWSLLNADARKAKIKYEGTKKVDGRDAHVLEYVPKNGSDLMIKMYFDEKNFRHLRTEYSRVISARQGQTVDSSASQTSEYYKLTETFADFQNLNGLTIPKTYKIFYSFTGSSSIRPNREMEWTLSVTNFSLNQQLDQNSFNIDAK